MQKQRWQSKLSQPGYKANVLKTVRRKTCTRNLEQKYLKGIEVLQKTNVFLKFRMFLNKHRNIMLYASLKNREA